MEVNPPWTCDQCGRPILRVEDGWVEWLNNGNIDGREGASRSLRLVHQRLASPYADRKNACYHDEDHWFRTERHTVADLPLSRFMRPDGLVTLLSFLAEKRFSDSGEVLEMIKRLHVPNYEAARHHFDSAIANGVFEPTTPPTYYDQEQLNAVLEWVKQRPQET